jgi:hypothetical protein
MKKLGIIAGVGAALAAVLMLAGVAFAQDGGVSVSDGTAAPGEQGDVTVDLTAPGDPGLGAWTLDVSYDSSVITAVDCSPEQGGVCNEAFSDNEVRITGASASGIDEDTSLGSITFECGDAEGESDLTIAISVFADATIGDPQDLEPSVSNGTFTCGEQEEEPTATTEVSGGPDTGTGAGTDAGSMSLIIALIALAGAGVLVTGYGVSRFRA